MDCSQGLTRPDSSMIFVMALSKLRQTFLRSRKGGAGESRITQQRNLEEKKVSQEDRARAFGKMQGDDYSFDGDDAVSL